MLTENVDFKSEATGKVQLTRATNQLKFQRLKLEDFIQKICEKQLMRISITQQSLIRINSYFGTRE